MDTIETRNVFRIPECNLERLRQQIGKLAKRAEKLGLTPPRVIEEGHEDLPVVVERGVEGSGKRTVKTFDPEKFMQVDTIRIFTIRLEGEAPVLPGYKLVVVIEHGNTELGNVLRVAPGMTCPPQYRTAQPWCEHCRTTRKRLETFVLLKEEGEALIQVGRNCLADYCRDPEAANRLCSYAELFESMRGLCEGSEDEEFFGMGRTIQRAPVEAVLSMTARIIRHCGWLSRSKAREDEKAGTPTADIVSAVFFDRDFFKVTSRTSNATRALQDAARNVEQKDVELATAALEWVRAMRPQAESLQDYLYNLLVVASEETVQRKHFGILCSAISSYQRHLDQEEGRVREKAIREASEHLGEEKQRLRLYSVTFLGSKAFEGGSYGYWRGEPSVRWLHRFMVDNKNLACWWTGKELDFERGQQVFLMGTVKSHDDYKGTKQTTLTRCDVYTKDDVGKCPNCGGIVLPLDKKKNCPHCKKRGLKVCDEWFDASRQEGVAHGD